MTIENRLTLWAARSPKGEGEQLALEAAAEIGRLRVAELEEAIRRLADQDATLSVQGGNVTVTLDSTLTDEEREAVEQAIDAANGMGQAEPWTMRTLRGLLERLGGER